MRQAILLWRPGSCCRPHSRPRHYVVEIPQESEGDRGASILFNYLQILGRKIQNLSKFKSLIAKHLNETVISSATSDDLHYRATRSTVGMLLAHTRIACSHRMSCTCREAAGSKSVRIANGRGYAGSHLSSVRTN